MNDDFELFDRSSADPVDPDVALITAYLARELSPVQIVAVEDRLASDAAFLRKVSPILDAWVLPTALSAVHAGQGPLSRDEVEAGWARYVGEHAELDAHEGPRLVVEGAQRKRRKISMTRIAAGVAAITLPVLALAQVVVYASKHPSVPGHSAAKNLVAPFVAEPPLAPEPVQPAPHKPPPTPEDVRVGRQLENTKVAVQRGEPVRVPAAESLKAAAPQASQVVIANPDRAKIAALVNAHMPEVVRGDTSADFAVIVLNAADNYVWSTYGNGAVVLVVGGDKRTPGERIENEMRNATAYTGVQPGARGGGGVLIRDTGMIAGTGIPRARGGRADTIRGLLDTIAYRLRAMNDSGSMRLRADTAVAYARGGGGSISRVGGGMAAPAFGAAVATPLDSGSYIVSFTAPRAVGGVRVPTNDAPGLQEPNKGESGIQGLTTRDLVMGERYPFMRNELGPNSRPLRVLVVHLAPGSTWTGR